MPARGAPCRHSRGHQLCLLVVPRVDTVEAISFAYSWCMLNIASVLLDVLIAFI